MTLCYKRAQIFSHKNISTSNDMKRKHSNIYTLKTTEIQSKSIQYHE